MSYILILEIIGLFFISVIGTLLHFAYKWLNNNIFIGMFAAIDESIIEHIKIAIVPVIIWLAFEVEILGYIPGISLAKFVEILSIAILIVILFYSYTAILKKNILFIDIFIFYFSIAVGQFISYNIICNFNGTVLFEVISKFCILLILIFICVFSYIRVINKKLNNSKSEVG